MVKTRRSLNGDGDAEDRDYCAATPRDRPSEEKCVADWSQRELRSNRYRVTRTIQRWPAQLVSRRLRTIKMPRIMFPESDTEPEKYSRRRPVRVFFEDEPMATRRRVRPCEPKNYMEDSEDKPIQQNVRRSGRQRKLLHHNFNESWITNELKVKGYPGLYAGLCASTSSDDCSLDERPLHTKTARTPNGQTNTDEDAAAKRRTSARCSANKKLTNEASESEESQETEKTVLMSPEGVKSEEGESQDGGDKMEVTQPKEEIVAQQDSESNQAPASNMRLRRQRPVTRRNKKDSHQDTASESELSDSSGDIVLNRAPRRSNRTRKPKQAFVEITKRPPRPAKTYSIRKKPYSLRERKPPKMLRRKTMRSQSPSSSSSSTSSSDAEADLNVSVKNKTKARQKSKSMGDHSERALREIQPMELDGTVTFSSVGGLEEHIQCLREMVLFPLMYPDLFSKFKTRPAKGVLFHGPPGTGKTLLARALANECSQIGGRKVSFFMRKGADCLKKWVGESERHLKLLFQQANKMKPSIIFFDEIDALAPVRSVRQEQVHTSVVGTLLAEVDGLCDRGDVIVIGATNRPDAVDPALRRAGRFDRELYFPSPGALARRDILHIYTADWTPPPAEETLRHVADLTNGYGGSDLKALCSEAVLRALRRVYPQVYESEHALVIDTQKVEVTEADLKEAMTGLVACGARTSPLPSRALPPHTAPLLGAQLQAATDVLRMIAPHFLDSKYQPACGWSGGVMLVAGPCAESHLAPALLAALERCTVKELSLATLHSALMFSHEQALISLFSECRRADRGCALFVRDVDALWSFLGATGAALFTQLWRSGAAGANTLMLCTSSVTFEELPDQCRALLPMYAQCVYGVREPTLSEVLDFLKPLVEQSTRPPLMENKQPPPPLPRAPPPPPPQETREQYTKRKKQEDYKLRELRIFLRDICRKLAANRRFYKFTKPVDLEEVTDYLDIVNQPMDLETMMTKVDQHRYNCAEEFLQDIDLICANALEYNPDRTSSDKQIRHEACALRDHAHAFIDVEMDSDFEMECRAIARRRRDQGAALDPDLPSFIYTASNQSIVAPVVREEEPKTPASNVAEKSEVTPHSSRKRRRRLTAWSKGLAKRPKTSHKTYIKEEPQIAITDEESKENKPMMSSTPLANGTVSSNDETMSGGENDVTVRAVDDSDLIFNLSAHGQVKPSVINSPSKSSERSSTGGATKTTPKKRNSGQESSHSEANKLIIDKTELENIVYKNAKCLRSIGLQALLELHSQLSTVIQKYSRQYDRSQLPSDLRAVFSQYTNVKK